MDFKYYVVHQPPLQCINGSHMRFYNEKDFVKKYGKFIEKKYNDDNDQEIFYCPRVDIITFPFSIDEYKDEIYWMNNEHLFEISSFYTHREHWKLSQNDLLNQFTGGFPFEKKSSKYYPIKQIETDNELTEELFNKDKKLYFKKMITKYAKIQTVRLYNFDKYKRGMMEP